jgi:hypothetical protein
MHLCFDAPFGAEKQPALEKVSRYDVHCAQFDRTAPVAYPPMCATGQKKSEPGALVCAFLRK